MSRRAVNIAILTSVPFPFVDPPNTVLSVASSPYRPRRPHNLKPKGERWYHTSSSGQSTLKYRRRIAESGKRAEVKLEQDRTDAYLAYYDGDPVTGQGRDPRSWLRLYLRKTGATVKPSPIGRRPVAGWMEGNSFAMESKSGLLARSAGTHVTMAQAYTHLCMINLSSRLFCD